MGWYVLPDNLADDDFSFGAGLTRVVERVDARVDDRADFWGGLDVCVLVDDEEDVQKVDAGTELVWLVSSLAHCINRRRVRRGGTYREELPGPPRLHIARTCTSRRRAETSG